MDRMFNIGIGLLDGERYSPCQVRRSFISLFYFSSKYLRYQGDMNRAKRDQAVQVFMAKEKARVMLMSLKCGGMRYRTSREVITDRVSQVLVSISLAQTTSSRWILVGPRPSRRRPTTVSTGWARRVKLPSSASSSRIRSKIVFWRCRKESKRLLTEAWAKGRVRRSEVSIVFLYCNPVLMNRFVNRTLREGTRYVLYNSNFVSLAYFVMAANLFGLDARGRRLTSG